MVDDDFCSDFGDIFDVDWFISSLSKDVKIVRELPKKGGKIAGNPYRMRVPRKCTPKCYQNRVLPALLKKHVWLYIILSMKIRGRCDCQQCLAAKCIFS